MSDPRVDAADAFMEMSTNFDPVKAFRLMLEICGDDTDLMLRKHQLPPLLDMTTELTRLRELRDAVRDAGPWPIVLGTPDAWVCRHCAAWVETRPLTIQHKPDCVGVRIRNLLAALDGGEVQGE